MIKAYLYYPTPNTHISIHCEEDCGVIQMHHRGDDQRILHISMNNLTDILLSFHQREHRFAPESGLNDMYLFVDLGDQSYEIATVNFIWGMLQKRYTPFSRIKPEVHCPKLG